MVTGSDKIDCGEDAGSTQPVRNLTSRARKQVVALWDDGYTLWEISRELSLPASLIAQVISETISADDPIGVCPLCHKPIFIPYCEHIRIDCPNGGYGR